MSRLTYVGLTLVLAGVAMAHGAVKDGPSAGEDDFDTLIVIGLSPLGSVEQDFFFGLYWSSRLQREAVTIEPGFPPGWATTLSLRLIEGEQGVLELHDPTGLVHRFTARRSRDQWVADDEFVLDLGAESGCGGRVTDPEGYVWAFDADGYVREVRLPDGTAIRVIRDPQSHRLLRIEADPVMAWRPIRRAADIRIQYWKWPVFARWPRPEANRLWLAAGQSLPAASFLFKVPAATVLEVIWEHPAQWTLTDDVGRYWSMVPLDNGNVLMAGTTLYPQIDEVATAIWHNDAQRIRGVPAWIFFEAYQQLHQAEERNPTPDFGHRQSSPVAPARPPLAVCPNGWEECGRTITLPETGRSQLFVWNWQDVFYQGRLTWYKRYVSRGGLACTPGDWSERTVTIRYSQEVALTAGLGLDGIGSWEVGITSSQSATIQDVMTVYCCHAWFGDRLVQSCQKRFFQAYYPHTLHYRYQTAGMQDWSAWQQVRGVWKAPFLDHLRCCDRCCPG